MHTVLLLGLLSVLLLPVFPAWSQTTQLTLTWDAVTKDVKGVPTSPTKYTLYRSFDGGATYAKVVDAPSTQTQANDLSVPGGNVCYTVTAWNAVGESAASNRLCFQVPSAAPESPLNLRQAGPPSQRGGLKATRQLAPRQPPVE